MLIVGSKLLSPSYTKVFQAFGERDRYRFFFWKLSCIPRLLVLTKIILQTWYVSVIQLLLLLTRRDIVSHTHGPIRMRYLSDTWTFTWGVCVSNFNTFIILLLTTTTGTHLNDEVSAKDLVHFHVHIHFWLPAI